MERVQGHTVKWKTHRKMNILNLFLKWMATYKHKHEYIEKGLEWDGPQGVNSVYRKF